ncbi:MAG: aminotransferase class I/II-fold pyridoxal phosphate-dependent enzyme [Phycisphaerae bacterium]|nr:aminotransferase class I/II-fold pyridoxal phosphate-dependent enzyme [Phycisphaerae bacterium]
MNSSKPVSLNLNVRGMGASATLAIKEVCRRLRGQGKHIYDFGLGQSPFPVPGTVVDALRHSAHEKDYLPVQGLPALREAVAEFHRRRDHIAVDPSRVLIGPGSKELMFLLQLSFYGEIVLRTPCWVSYLPQARIIGRQINLMHTSFETGWKIRPEQLLERLEGEQDDLRPRLFILNYPSNPTGHTYTADELKELAEVARRFQLIILSDEIYGQLHYQGEHVSIARFYPERTIVSSGLSKWCGAGGWRLGTFTFPEELQWLLESMAAVASETYTSVCAPVQYAAVEAFHCGVSVERYLWHVRRILSAMAQRCVSTLHDAGIALHPPAGSFYLYPDLSPLKERAAARGIRSGAVLCRRLLEETGVAVLPGSSFARPAEELTLRLSFVDFDGASALAASENVPLDQPLPEATLERCCRNVFEGVERVAAWAKAL